MRPLLLTMSAFGPYAGKTIINMNTLGDSGLYLITGDTGAGKSTIFDAICFALFGSDSGKGRDVSLFRSKYADVSMPTEVELVFLHCDKEYRIRRNPDYERLNKRGNGTTNEPAKAELYLPSGEIISKMRDVNAKIEEILGVNRLQFSQIAMIAQGDFMKLLLAPTKDRQDIFRELFKTGYYQKLQFKLEDERKILYGQIDDIRKSIKQYVMGICTDEDDALSVLAAKAREFELSLAEIIKLIEQLVINDSDTLKSLEKSIGDMNEELGEVNAKIGVAEATQKNKEKLEQTETGLTNERPKQEALKVTYDLCRTKLGNKDKLLKEAAVISNSLSDYDEYDLITNKIQKLMSETENTRLLINNNSDACLLKSETLETLKKEQASLLEVTTRLIKLGDDYEKAKDTRDRLFEFKEEYEEYIDEKANLLKLQNKYAKDDAEFKKLQDHYETLDQTFRDAQAGILASTLSEGKPCPVCGSTTHPNKASLVGDVPTEAALKTAKKQADQARNLATKSSEECKSSLSSLRTKEEMMFKSSDKLLKSKDIDALEELLFKAISRAEERVDEIDDLIAVEEKKLERKGELDKMIPDIEEETDKLKELVNSLKNDLSAKEAALAEKQKAASEKQAKLKFQGKKEALDKIHTLETEAKKLQDDFDKADLDYKNINKTIDELSSMIQTLKDTISESSDIDISEERARQSELIINQKNIIDNKQKIATRIDNNTKIRTMIEKQAGNLSALEDKYQWVAALSDTANGKLKGKEKITLETYIQTTYFDRIIARANLRLLKMSAGQYELKRRESAADVRSQSGLELDVIDHYNGSERSVKTLSGGESFMASLSLALGLSDEVQSQAGGIRIDTMFVDEGFGSLDPDALELAYSSLASLTEGNKLVGIISHVTDLKSRVDKQIIVTKEKSGGSFVKLQV